MMTSIGRLVGSIARKSPQQIAQHTVRRWSDALDTRELDFPLLPEDIADSHAATRPDASPLGFTASPGRRRLGWIVLPPGAGSGGHTTLFRMMEAARIAGFTNTLLFYDRYRSDHARNVAVLRAAWPWLECEVEPVRTTLTGFDGVIASSWPTAHVAARRRVPGQPVIYFIQDFEPYFYPRGSEYAIAEDSYRLGHRNVALGGMVHDTLGSEVQVASDYVPFGCDTDAYRLRASPVPRSGVVFYAKRGNDRRGHRLAVMALSDFHRRHPEQSIHTYGDAPRDLPFPVLHHGSLPPDRLNELYNSVIAGVAMSFTNISLVAEEMLAAGVIPVVNDSPLARADLGNPHVAWADPTPRGISDALSAAVTAAAPDERARTVSASVTTPGWAETGRRFAALIAAELDSSMTAGRIGRSPSRMGGGS